MSNSIPSVLSKKMYKIIFLGDSNTGKTSIIERFVNNKFSQAENATIGIDFISKNISYKGITCRLQLWDTAGQEKFRSLIPSYLKDAACAIIVFDVSSPETLKNIPEWIELFKENRGEKGMLIICGNKSDLQKKYEKEKLSFILEKYKVRFYQVSAKEGNGVQELFHGVVDLMNENHIAKKNKLKEKEDEPPDTQKPIKIEDQKKIDEKEEKNEKGKTKLALRKEYFCCGG